jgi:hypothetical protein
LAITGAGACGAVTTGAGACGAVTIGLVRSQAGVAWARLTPRPSATALTASMICWSLSGLR